MKLVVNHCASPLQEIGEENLKGVNKHYKLQVLPTRAKDGLDSSVTPDLRDSYKRVRTDGVAEGPIEYGV